MADTNDGGFIIQKEKDKLKNKCRKWELRISLGMDPRTGKYKTKSRRFNGTYAKAKAARGSSWKRSRVTGSRAAPSTHSKNTASAMSTGASSTRR